MHSPNDTEPERTGERQPAGWAARCRQAYDRILDQDPLDLLCRLTLLMCILHPFSAPGITWYQSIVIIAMATCAVVYRPLLRMPAFWFALAAFRFISINLSDWAFSNNHDWLITYWCLALACSMCLPDTEAALAINGRWLLRLAFLFATLWKLTSPDFLNGNVNEYLLYGDARFSAMARALGDFTFQTGDFDSQLAKRMDALHESIPLREDRMYPRLAKLLTWWTVFIEAAISILLMFDRRGKPAVLGDVALLIFIATTYCWLNVFGFAWILIIMALAQCPREYRKIRFSFLLMLFWAFFFAGGDLKAALLKLLAT